MFILLRSAAASAGQMGFGRFRSGGAASGAAQRLWVLSSKQMLR